MSSNDPTSAGFSLKRWSQRKLDAARVADAARPSAAAPQTPAAPAGQPAAAALPAAAGRDALADTITDTSSLPSIETLTSDSDFTVFFGPKVDPRVKLAALKKLFSDPRFNVMDRLDVYIDDYSIPDPIAPELVRQLLHARYVFDPPRTRVNAAGIVEDIPPDEIEVQPETSPLEAPPDAAALPPPAPAAEIAKGEAATETQSAATETQSAATETQSAATETQSLPPPSAPAAAGPREAGLDAAAGLARSREGSEPQR